MILIINRQIIAQAKKDQNLFTLEFAYLGKAMAIIKIVSILLKAMVNQKQG